LSGKEYPVFSSLPSSLPASSSCHL
jgi:hypothetical protein